MLRGKVLFICTHNSSRSQMAEGLLNHLYGDTFWAFSAGTKATNVNPYAVRVMEEIGIDISKNRSKSIEEFRGEKFDCVVTVCDSAKKTCPFFPGKRVIHKAFKDPALMKGDEQEVLQVFRNVREDIRDWIIKTFGTVGG